MPSNDTACIVSEAGSVTPCWALRETVAGGAFDQRKGVVEWNIINTKTGKPSRDVFGVRSGKHEKRGLVFNYCPFCGAAHRNPEGMASAALALARGEPAPEGRE